MPQASRIAARIHLNGATIPCSLYDDGTSESRIVLASAAGIPSSFVLETSDGRRGQVMVTLRKQGGDGATLYVTLPAIEKAA